MTPASAETRAILSQGRAAVFEEPIGPAGVRIRERPKTKPAPGSVAVAVKAASINHLDLWLASAAGAGVAGAAAGSQNPLAGGLSAPSRSEAKRQRALELGAEAVFVSAAFSKAVRQVTGDGVDVVFEHVGPATLEESMRSLAIGGRVVTCGSTSGVKAEITMPRIFFRHAGLLGSTMGNASEFESVLKAIDGGLRPVVDSVYPLADVQAALTRLDAAEQFGKVVLSVSAF